MAAMRTVKLLAYNVLNLVPQIFVNNIADEIK
jgi:hypothetical protein